MSFSSLKSLPVFAALAVVMVTLTLVGATVPVQAQTYTILDNFLLGGPGPQWAGGPLTQGRDGDLYGYSYLGGATNNGSIWKTSAAGTVSVVHSFAAGNDCQSGMTLGTDGNFYGTALTNCAGAGYVFKMTPGGTITVLHTFTGAPDGSGPGLLTQYTDGNFYGITNVGGANNLGSVFKITPAGVLTTLYSFPGGGPANPTYGLTVGNDGNFYGTFTGNSGWRGGLFKMTPAGAVTLLHVFFDTPDGATPASGVILGKDGNFYGTTQYGGVVFDGHDYEGTVFKMTPAGTVTILHSFNIATDYAAYPTAPLLQASDGNFYGVIAGCAEFGCNGLNDMFKITPTGTLTVLQKFTGTNGSYPYWPLTQDTNGTIYGLAQQGGTDNGGVLFSLNIGAGSFASLLSTSGRVGSKIGILGQGFSASSVVKFHGVTATTVTRTGTSFLLATVPTGASDGNVTVTTGATTLTSSKKFIVHNSWAAGAPMPVAAVAACSAVLNGQIYVVGGYNSSAQNAVQIYNPTTNKWTTGTALTSALSNQACAAVNGAVYEFGGTPNTGGSQTNAVLAYNPATKIWSSKHAMPTARQDIVAVVANSLVYVIGGYNGNRVTTVEAYNPATDTWSTESSVLVAQSGEVGGVVAGNIVISGGAGQSTDTGDTESYSVSGNAWTSLKADATVRNNPCGGVVGASLYVAGGANRGGSSFTGNESFSPSKNSWTTLAPLPQATTDPASAVSGGQLFCFGGFTGLGGATLNNVQIYQP